MISQYFTILLVSTLIGFTTCLFVSLARARTDGKGIDEIAWMTKRQFVELYSTLLTA